MAFFLGWITVFLTAMACRVQAASLFAHFMVSSGVL